MRVGECCHGEMHSAGIRSACRPADRLCIATVTIMLSCAEHFLHLALGTRQSDLSNMLFCLHALVRLTFPQIHPLPDAE